MAFGVACDEENRVAAVFRDCPGLSIAPGTPFAELFDAGSRAKSLQLLAAVRSRQAAYGWELNVRVAHEPVLMHFVGALAEGNLLIAGAEIRSEATHMLAALLHHAPRSGDVPPVAEGQATLELYEELSQLNNRLVNAQRELQRSHAELKRVTAERARLAAMAAHDLRTPASTIAFCAELLEKTAGLAPGSQPGQLVEMIRRNGERMVALINDVLSAFSGDLAEFEATLRPIRLEQVAQASVRANGLLAAQKRIAVRLEGPEALPAVPGDPARLEQVLDNLLRNAIKFSPEGSSVTVAFAARGAWVEVAVRDQGLGMSPQELRALLEGKAGALRLGTHAEPGFGLGFAIIRAIVARHRGQIDGESTPGQGTTIRVRLPAIGGAQVNSGLNPGGGE